MTAAGDYRSVTDARRVLIEPSADELASMRAASEQPLEVKVAGTRVFSADENGVHGASGATAARPDPATAGAGAMFYDTTLSKPIWSDGAAWKDATGTAV